MRKNQFPPSPGPTPGACGSGDTEAALYARAEAASAAAQAAELEFDNLEFDDEVMYPSASAFGSSSAPASNPDSTLDELFGDDMSMNLDSTYSLNWTNSQEGS
jgi:hypothetical protein